MNIPESRTEILLKSSDPLGALEVPSSFKTELVELLKKHNGGGCEVNQILLGFINRALNTFLKKVKEMKEMTEIH